MCPGKPVNCGLQESKGDTEGGKGEMSDGRRELVVERCEEGQTRERDGVQVNYTDDEGLRRKWERCQKKGR